MTVVVRPVEPGEYHAVAELTVAAYAASAQLTHDTYPPTLRDVATRVQVAEVLVAVDEITGELLGTVTFVLPGSELSELARPGEAEFRMLAVAPEAQGRGAGAALVRACERRAREVGATALVIYTRDVASTAQRLYARLGFVRTPELDWVANEHVTLLALRLVL